MDQGVKAESRPSWVSSHFGVMLMDRAVSKIYMWNRKWCNGAKHSREINELHGFTVEVSRVCVPKRLLFVSHLFALDSVCARVCVYAMQRSYMINISGLSFQAINADWLTTKFFVVFFWFCWKIFFLAFYFYFNLLNLASSTAHVNSRTPGEPYVITWK